MPEYNIDLRPPNVDNTFNHFKSNHSNKMFVQYHNMDSEKRFPGTNDQNKFGNKLMSDCTHYISTKKKLAVNLKGAKIILIVGIKGKKKKNYHIWSITEVEDMSFFNDEDLSYNISGLQDIINPVLLNSINGFNDFLKKCGNFGYGLQSINNLSFKEELTNICNNNIIDYDCLKDDFMNGILDSYKDWID